MAIDPRQLKPSELVRLLNSTALGEVTSERQLYRDRQRAGYRIGDRKQLDLVRYTAWLAWERHNPKPSPPVESYDQLKDQAARRSASLSASGRIRAEPTARSAGFAVPVRRPTEPTMR